MKIQNVQVDTQTVATAQPVYSTAISLLGTDSDGIGYCKGYGIALVATVTAPAAGTFTAAASDVCTKSAHGYLTGLKVQVSTTTTLPAGLSAATDYFVIKIDAGTFKLATNLSNAIAGTAIDITDAGTGTHTITPTAIAGCSYTLYGSVDGTTYVSLAVTNNITTTANFIHEKIDPMFDYLKVYYTLTAGQISVVQTTLVKGF